MLHGQWNNRRWISEQAESTSDGSKQVERLGETIQENEAKVDTMNQATRHVVDVVAEGLITMEALMQISENSSLETKTCSRRNNKKQIEAQRKLVKRVM